MALSFFKTVLATQDPLIFLMNFIGFSISAQKVAGKLGIALNL